MTEATGPATEAATLAGVRVLDLSRAVSGPYVGRLLADLGADVVKVEAPEGDVSDQFGRQQAGRSGLFAQMNAGKRVVRLDFREPSDVATALDLAAVADVVVENFRVGVLDRLGLGYAAMRERNAGVVVLSISGFGAASPEATRRAYAPVVHAESGMLLRHGRMDGRLASDLPAALADTIAGLHGTVAVLAALRARDHGGEGQHIDLSMLDALVASDDHVHHAIEGDGQAMPSRGLVWDAPGGPLLLAVEMGATWKFLTRTHGLTDPGPADAPLEEKARRRRAIVAAWIQSFPTRQDLLTAVEGAGISWADVRAPEDLLQEPSLQARPPYAEVDDGDGGVRRVVRMPYRFSHAADAEVGPVPKVEDATAVLAGWGAGLAGAEGKETIVD